MLPPIFPQSPHDLTARNVDILLLETQALVEDAYETFLDAYYGKRPRPDKVSVYQDPQVNYGPQEKSPTPTQAI